ncbi:MAG: hypothetical protein JNG90_19205, partial [Planctomycetaceae bacterium]|nr:hypothetical protein [Planctomycetaceae bacterium]
MNSRMLLLALGLTLAPGLLALAYLVEAPLPTDFDGLQKAFGAGNFNDAFVGLRKRLVDEKQSDHAPESLGLAVQALARLGRVSEVDS